MTEVFNGLLAGKSDVYAYVGGSFPAEEVQIQDAGGTPYDLTGDVLEWTVKSYDDAGGPPLIYISTTPNLDGEIQMLDANTFRRVISSEVLAAKLPRTGTPTNELTMFRHEFYRNGELYLYGDFYLKGDTR